MEYDEMSNNAFELLNKGVDVFNEWRLKNYEIRLNFNERNFRNGEFPNCLFVNADFINADFEQALLDNALFSNSNLKGAQFYGASARDTIFGVPELINMKLDESFQKHLVIPGNLEDCFFMAADMTNAIFRETNIKGANFVRSFLDHTDFRGTNYQEANFEGARLGKSLFPL